MQTKLFLKLFVASLCAFFACWLPSSLSKAHEINTVPVAHFEAISAALSVNVGSLPYLRQTPDEAAAKAYIYQHESGGNQYAINPSSGSCGLGQALPCDKMGCALSNYACQDQWFSNYAYRIYGSWAAAASFWRANRWW